MKNALKNNIMNSKIEVSKLVTPENHEAINHVLAIAKQDIALQNAINALNELSHLHKIEFESYGQSYGINENLLDEVRSLKSKLNNAKYGRY